MASQRSSHHLIHTRLDGAKRTRNHFRNPDCRKGLDEDNVLVGPVNCPLTGTSAEQ